MAKYLDDVGLELLWSKIKERDTTTLTAAQNDASSKYAVIGDVTTLQGYFTSGAAKKAIADGNGKNIASTYATIEALNNLSSTISPVTTELVTIKGWFDTSSGAAKKAIADENGNNIASTYVKKSQVGAKNGVASLDENGQVPSSQLPAYVDDVVEGYYYQSKFYKEAAHTTVITGEGGKVYLDLSTNKSYRWSGSAYAQIKGDLAIGETTGTAYDGAKGKANAQAIEGLQEDLQNLDAQGVKYSGQGVTANTVDGAITELSQKINEVSGEIPTIEAITTTEINNICV